MAPAHDAFAPQVNPKDISIDADLDELSVVVSYVVEITHLDASGASVGSEKVRGHLYCCVLVYIYQVRRRLLFMRVQRARVDRIKIVVATLMESGLGLEFYGQLLVYWYYSSRLAPNFVNEWVQVYDNSKTDAAASLSSENGRCTVEGRVGGDRFTIKRVG